jgi:hypothetical protein
MGIPGTPSSRPIALLISTAAEVVGEISSTILQGIGTMLAGKKTGEKNVSRSPRISDTLMAFNRYLT